MPSNGKEDWFRCSSFGPESFSGLHYALPLLSPKLKVSLIFVTLAEVNTCTDQSNLP